MMENQQQISIKPEDTKAVECENCSGIIFQDCFMIRTVSAILSPTGKEEVFKIPVPVCIQCGKPAYGNLNGEKNGSDG